MEKPQMQENEYGGNTMCSCMKMEKTRPVGLFQEWGREDDGGVNSTVIYCKNFC
jgi:hypothetical protein